MSITLDELFLLVGRLDDAPGFDSPRERFRRFLLDRVTDVPTARALVDECQRSVGEQRHRALQDLVVIAGRFLGFEIIFDSYERTADIVKVDGQWRSPGLLDVVLEIRTEQTPSPSLDALAAATAAATVGRAEPRLGLCVVARQFAARDKLSRTLATDPRLTDMRTVSVRSLMALAARAAADRLAHADIVALLKSSIALDFVIDLLDRPGIDGQSSEPAAERSAAAPRSRRQPSFWAATITWNETATPEQLLGSVIASRRVLATCHTGRLRGQASPGDWVCFFVPGKGIVGHAQLAAILDDGEKVVRHSLRFNCIYRLEQVVLYERPIAQALRADRPFETPPTDVPLAGPCLAPMIRQDFLALTTYRDDTTTIEEAKSATA